MKPAISVIVPIYNIEKYIRRALDSILAQTFSNFELLLIDDGSTDSCKEICDEYGNKHQHIRVFHKENGGLSSARNYGLERALGEYTIFFDPDDWVEPQCLEELYSIAEKTKADVVMCAIYYNDKYRQTYSSQRPSSTQARDVLKDLITGGIGCFTVNKLIRRMCYVKYNISYPFGIYGREDQYAICNLFKNDIKIAYTPRAYYHYVQYPHSLSRFYDEETLQMDIRTRDMFVELFADTEYKELVDREKTKSIISRAYLFGEHVYNSRQFQKRFGQYQSLFMKGQEPRYMTFLYYMAFHGYYRLSKKLFNIGFQTKQACKKGFKCLHILKNK